VTYAYRYEGRRRYNAENPEADRCSDGAIRATHCTGPEDTSPVHSTYPTGYDSRCGWCYLNANHTQDEHRANVERAEHMNFTY